MHNEIASTHNRIRVIGYRASLIEDSSKILRQIRVGSRSTIVEMGNFPKTKMVLKVSQNPSLFATTILPLFPLCHKFVIFLHIK